MPFTLVHPAAVLPLLRTPLVPSALVAGSVAPDLPYYVSLRWTGGDLTLTRTHEAASLLWLSPLLGLALLTVWHLLLARPLRALLPPAAAARLPAPSPWTAARVAWVVPAVVVGAATHLAWDALGSAVGHGWASRVDLAGGVVGGAILLGWLAHRWSTMAPRALPEGTVLSGPARRAVLAGLALVAVGGGAVQAVRLLPEVRDSYRESGTGSLAAVLEDEARIFAEHAVTALVVAVLLYAALWHAARLRRMPAVG
ncbi:DUF4184 family protein [Blastococcus sp. CCUG 61487]|uniref:DUF4184 family protein n=1 Tax=Blastococcus sp. CCUG 61487 TaxID=1840703 RepID=UPI0010C157CD|nr:DUF4184 family protein [Blastococcus sp. CCUG 61487]TKJ34226.1 hypothetical protein A6V29_15290 [Blastococcus sp. CCUG 61487]